MEIENDTASVAAVKESELAGRCEELARRSLCHCLIVSTELAPFEVAGAAVAQIRLAGPEPELFSAGETLAIESDAAMEAWIAALESLLRLWI